MTTQELLPIAMRIRMQRELHEYSLDAAAKACNMSPEKYAEIETGTVDIPISLLYSLSSLFDVEITTLLTGEEPKLRVYSLVRAGKGIDVDRHKEYRYQSLAYKFQNKKAEPFYVTADPKPEGTPVSLNTHIGHEFDYVLKGRLRVVIGKADLVLEEGDSLYFDSSYPHGMQAVGDQSAVFLAIVL